MKTLGKRSVRLCSTEYDDEIGEWYVEISEFGRIIKRIYGGFPSEYSATKYILENL